MKKKSTVIVIFTTILMLVLYQNCAPQLESPPNQLTSPSGDPNNINNWKEPVPAFLCGKSGYGYLLRNYIRTNCGGCHSAGGFAFPSFADADLEISYWGALMVGKDRWAPTTTNNQFCGPQCNLSADGAIFQGLQQWVQNSTANCN